MAARRLLIVMLVLLGLSTLAAALVPQHALRAPNATSSTTTTTQAPTTTTSGPSPAFFPPTKIVVGRKVKVDGKKRVQVPVVSPLQLGEQISLHVHSEFPTQLSIPAFGLVGFAAPDVPAIFELVAETPGKAGILFEPSGKVAARICVVSPKGKKPKGC
jgi:hypothetical protein